MSTMSSRERTNRKATHLLPSTGGTGTLDSVADRRLTSLRRFLKMLGPGPIVGVSADNPSGIGTYATAGTSFGFATRWMALVTWPMMSTVRSEERRVGKECR